MRQLFVLSLPLFVGLMLAFHLACNQNSYPSSSSYGGGGGMYPTATPTTATTPCPSCTPTFTPVHIYYNGSFRYSLTPTSGAAISQPVTVAVNQQVVFDAGLSGHPLYIDNGTACSVNNNMSFPYNFTPSAAANYLVHCGLHGACANNSACPASSCGGMAFTIHAQ